MHHLQRTFGSVTQGSIQCGKVEQVAKFHIGLTWPTGMAVVKPSKTCGTEIVTMYVVTGRYIMGILSIETFTSVYNKLTWVHGEV